MPLRLRAPAGSPIVNAQHWSLPPYLTAVRQTLICAEVGFSPNRLQPLKTVSGRLRRLFGGRSKMDNPEPAHQTILIVDDEEAICFSMQEYFSAHGFEVDTAREVDEAERLIEKTDYNVIIQDLRLGQRQNAEGLEVVRFAHRQSPRTRIVVLTAYGSAENEIEAKRLGADAFLTKPQPLSQLAQVVTNLIIGPPPRSSGH